MIDFSGLIGYVETFVNTNHVKVSVSSYTSTYFVLRLTDEQLNCYTETIIDIPLLKAVRFDYIDSVIHRGIFNLMKMRYYNAEFLSSLNKNR